MLSFEKICNTQNIRLRSYFTFTHTFSPQNINISISSHLVKKIAEFLRHMNGMLKKWRKYLSMEPESCPAIISHTTGNHSIRVRSGKKETILLIGYRVVTRIISVLVIGRNQCKLFPTKLRLNFYITSFLHNHLKFHTTTFTQNYPLLKISSTYLFPFPTLLSEWA